MGSKVFHRSCRKGCQEKTVQGFWQFDSRSQHARRSQTLFPQNEATNNSKQRTSPVSRRIPMCRLWQHSQRHTNADDSIPAHPRTDSIITSTSMSESVSAPRSEELVSALHSPPSMRKNPPWRILSGRWHELCRWKATSPPFSHIFWCQICRSWRHQPQQKPNPSTSSHTG